MYIVVSGFEHLKGLFHPSPNLRVCLGADHSAQRPEVLSGADGVRSLGQGADR